MSELSDIQLRIRVEVVNSASLNALVSGMAKVETASKKVKTTTKSLVGSFSNLGDGMTRTTGAASRQRRVNADLAKGVATLTGVTGKLGASTSRNVGLNARLARGVQILTSRTVATSSATSRADKTNRNLARGVAILTGASSRLGASSSRNVGLNARLARGVRILTASTVATSSATSRADRTNRDLARGVRTLTNDMTRTSAATARASAAKDRSAAASQRAANSASKLAAQEQRLNSFSSKLGRAFDKVAGNLSTVERKLDAVFRAGVHMQSMGRDLLGFAKKMFGAATKMVDSWGDFEYTLNRAAAASNVFDTKSAIYDKLKQSIYSVAHELRVFPAEEVARGLYFWESTTGDVIETQDQLTQTMKNVTAVMELSAMTNTGYEATIKGVYAVIKQFGLTTKDTADVSALLFYATQKTALELPDLINAFKMTGAVMGQAKEPLKTMVAVLGTIANAGFRGSQAGRALRQTYIKIVKPTAVAKKELDALFKSQGGYNKVAFNSKGNFIGLEKYMMKMARATKDMTYQQRAHLLATITTANELPVMTQMLAAAERAVKSGSKSWVDNLVSQEQANANFAKSWQNMAGSWKGVIGGLKMAVQPILLETGAMIAKVLTPTLNELNVVIWDNIGAMTAMAKEIVSSFQPLVEWVGRVVKETIAWAIANPKIVKQIGRFAIMAAVIAGIAGSVLLAAGTFVFLLNSIVLIVIGMLPLIAVFIAAAAVIGLFAIKVYQNIGGIQQAFKAFALALVRVLKLVVFGSEDAGGSLSDLGETISGIASGAIEALSLALRKLSKMLNRITPAQAKVIRDVAIAIGIFIAANAGLNKINDGLKATSEALRGVKAAGKGIGAIGSVAVSSAKTTADAAGSIISGLMAIAIRFAPVLAAGITGALAPVLAVVAVVAAVIAGLVLAYTTNFLGFKDLVDTVVAWFVANVAPAIGTVFQAIADFINNVFVPALAGIANYFITTLTPLFTQVGVTIGAFMDLIGALVTVVLTALGQLGDAFAAVWTWIHDVLLGIGVDIGDFSLTAEGIFAWLATAVQNIVGPWLDGMISLFTTIFDGIVGGLTAFFRIIQGVFQVATGILTGNWQLVWDGIGNIVGGIIDTIQNAIGTFVGVLETVIRTGLGIVDGIFKTIFGEGPGSVYASISGFIMTITDFAGDIIGGLVKGIGDAIGPAITSVTGFIGQIIQGIKDFLGIKSPATIMLDIGLQVVKGLWKGVNDAKDWIVEKITSFITAVIPEPIRKALKMASPSKVMAEIGGHVVDGLAKGISETDSAIRAMNALASDISQVAFDATTSVGFAGSGNINVQTSANATQEVNLNVNVTSADSSVNSMDMNTLAGLITGSDMARSLERMASVD